MLLKVVLSALVVGMILAFGAVTFGQGESATCPRDGQQAQRTNVEQIHSNSCPGDLYNAERDTYSHPYINGPVLEQHTFSTTTCLSR
jgi:hypothetical protein